MTTTKNKTTKFEMNTENTALFLSHTGMDGGYHYWLTVDSIPVGYTKVYVEENDQQVNLCDIETREDYRNKGIAKKLLEMVAQKHNVAKISHTGGYTPDGANYLQNLVDSPNKNKTAEYNQMTFVKDWEETTIKYA